MHAIGDRAAQYLLPIGKFFLRVGKKFFADHCLDSAGSLTFTTLLSIIPTAMVIIWTLTSFEQATNLSLQAREFILDNLVPDAANQVKQVIVQLSERRHQVPVYAAAMLIVTALLLVHAIDDKINRIWHAGHFRHRGLRFVYYLLILVLAPILLGLSLALTSYIASMSAFRQGGILADPGHFVFIRLIPPLFTLLLLTLLFRHSPRENVKIRHALAGALLSSVLFEGGKYVFSWYVLQFPNYQIIYGALSFFPIFLIWVYLSWCIILLGVETSYCLAVPPLDRPAENR